MTINSLEVGDAAPLEWPRNPFPGLRPFREDECLIFYGRNSQKDEVLARLNQSQLVFITGPSGCGKSSLIKAGVLPALRAGLLTKAGYHWKILQMRPGRYPLGRIAAEFKSSSPAGAAASQSEQDLESLIRTEETALWLAADSIAPISRRSDGRVPMRLLLVIDQFEEIFGEQVQDPQDVGWFVRLLVRFAQRPHPNLFVIVTMRSDYLGQCANFEGLAESINRSQFLTPVLTEQELRQAIARPAEDYNGEVAPELVDQIISDMRTGFAYHPDSLPLMQHALLWLWSCAWRQSGCNEPPRPPFGDAGPRTKLTLAMYRENKGIQGILDRHAEDVLNEALGNSEERRKIAQQLFRRLSQRDSEGRYRRSPTSVDNICRIAGCTLDELREVINPFEQPDVCFLEQRPSTNTGETLVDVSHESLIRQWHTAKNWADTEAIKLRRFRELINAARSWERNVRSPDFLKRRGELEVIQSRWEKETPNAHWTSRYGLTDDFPQVEEYLRASAKTDSEERENAEREREERAAEKSLRQRDRNMGIAAFFFIICVAIGYLLYQQKQENIRQANENINQARVNSEYRVRTRALMADVTRDLRGPAKSLLVAMSAIGDSQPELPEMKRTAYRALAQLRERRILDHQTAVQSVQFAPDNPTILLTTTRDGNLRFWDTDTGRLKGNYHFIGGRFLTARWHPTGEGLFVSSRGIGSFFLLPCGSEELRPLFPGCTAKTVDEQTPFNEETGTGIFSPDGKWLVTGGFGLPTKLWDVTEIDKPIRNFGNTASFNVSAAFSPDSNRLALGTSTGELRIFEVAQARKPRELTPDVLKDTGSRPDGFQEIGAGITSVAFHPKDPNIVMATSQDGTIRIWDIEKRHPRRLHAEAAGGMVFQGVFNPAGTWIATAHEDRVIRLWPLAAAAPREQTLRGHDKIAFSISYNSDGSAIASGASDNTARIWSQRSTLARAPMIPSSTDLALGSVPITLRRDHLIFSYNGAEISAEVPSDFGTPAVAAIAPSGKDIVVAPKQGRPHLYDRASGTDFLTLPGRVEKWSQVGFYQDSTSDSGPIHIFGVTEDGRRYGWAYFQDLQELKRFAESKIPFVGIGVNERLSLEPDQLCRIEARPESECAPKDDSAPE